MFRPMLAATYERPEQLRFPLLLSPKLDGLRCVLTRGSALSRSLKPFRNSFVQSQLQELAFLDIDGELIVGSPTAGHVLGRTQSGIMATTGEPDFKLYAFDKFSFPFESFKQRLVELSRACVHPRVTILPQTLISSQEELALWEQQYIDEGYEGVILRCPDSHYKYGRATANENSMWKVKRFVDGEAFVESILEGEENLNEATTNALGLTERATRKEYRVGNRQVGTLICKDLATGETMNVSPGRLTQVERRFYFAKPEKLLRRIIKYKAFDYGALNTSRFRTFQAFRDEIDM